MDCHLDDIRDLPNHRPCEKGSSTSVHNPSVVAVLQATEARGGLHMDSARRMHPAGTETDAKCLAKCQTAQPPKEI